ncbi:hypothetical protein D1AOALGA4SA_7923 [Olavius algarvensis Delta 1 endosymbiont]|nr:hypothetical protein D1AOALGA4SA_7923 [Olavius algarvensis Delta 1 endosymbiont]
MTVFFIEITRRQSLEQRASSRQTMSHAYKFLEILPFAR